MKTYTVIDESNIDPIVSIAMLTYNHEKYIAEAIDSVLMQQTTFKYQIIVAEDFSTDNTRKIVLDYQKKYPDKIKLILQNNNKGMFENNLSLLENLKSKYVAALEGDDYWTDPLKLQKQVDFLEANPEYVLCFHRTNELNEFENKITNVFPEIQNNHSYEIENYILNNWTATCSMIFSREFLKIENWFTDLPFGDLGLVLILMKYSNKKAMVLIDIMGTYRIHSGGVHGNLRQNSKKMILAYKQQLEFAKIIQGKLLYEKQYSKTFMLKRLRINGDLYQLYKKEKQYFKRFVKKLEILLLKFKYEFLFH